MGADLRCEVNGRSQTVRIRTLREHKGRFLITLAGVNDATAAEAYAGATLYADRDRIELEPGEYLDVDLVDCVVRNVDGREYGPVQRVEHYPASDMLVVAGRMLPMVQAFIRSIDIDEKSIIVDIPAGLLDDDSETA